MIPLESKQNLVRIIQEAVSDGARVKRACEETGISFKSFQRWQGNQIGDRRKGAAKTVQRRLEVEEIERFYQTSNQQRFRDMTPGQIVAILAEEGIYLGSERTLNRIFKAKQALVSRTESRKPGPHRKPPELVATGPDQVWTWDITWLKTDVAGIFYYAYVVIDIFSRAIVGWSIESCESPDHAKKLFSRIVRDRQVKPKFVHADNGGPMKGLSLVAFLTQLQVGMSYSRPRVSDDNPFIESFFRTVKYHVSYPKVFTGLDFARDWFARFIDWYNMHHRHSGIAYVTPHQKHTGQDILLFERRQLTINAAAALHPERFVRGARTIAPVRQVRLNKAS